MQAGNIQNTASTLGIYAIQPPRPGSPPVHAPQDGNHDGLVSFGEAWTYSLKHPEINIIKELRTFKESNFISDQHQTLRIMSSLPFGSTAPQPSVRSASLSGLDLLA